MERLVDITDTFFGEVAEDDVAEEVGIRGPRLLSETAPHLGLLGPGFLKCERSVEIFDFKNNKKLFIFCCFQSVGLP